MLTNRTKHEKIAWLFGEQKMQYEVIDFKNLSDNQIKQLKKCCLKNGYMILILNRFWLYKRYKFKVALASDNNKIIGWSIFNDTCGHMPSKLNFQIYVKKSYRKLGIGTELIKISKENCKKPFVVACINNKTLKFYQKQLEYTDFLCYHPVRNVKAVKFDYEFGCLEIFI